ncbi:tyrosine-type recombinase/integrase [Bacteroides caecimuris]|nr:tyrosine-type recombinase/integrase [Bacteroides caecimuris]
MWQKNENPLISNGLRFIVTCLPTCARWVLFHCGRHSYASLLLENGVDIYTIKSLMGHTNVKTTQIYTHIVNEQKEKAANTLHIENLDL